MEPWMVWFGIAVLFVILEAFTADFLVIMFGAAALFSLVFSLVFPEAVIAQIIIWIVFSLLFGLCVKSFANKITNKTSQTNVYSVIGKKATVITEINTEKATGQVKVDGDIWSAKTEEISDIIPVNSTIEILRVDGVKVVVKKID